LLGLSSVDTRSISYHFVRDAYLTGVCKVRRYFMHLIWFACVCIIWQEEVTRSLKIRKKSITQLPDKVKYMSYWWLKAKIPNIYVGSYGWW